MVSVCQPRTTFQFFITILVTILVSSSIAFVVPDQSHSHSHKNDLPMPASRSAPAPASASASASALVRQKILSTPLAASIQHDNEQEHASRTTISSASSSRDQMMEEIQADIDSMRQEAMQRLEILNQEMHAAEEARKEHQAHELAMTSSSTIQNHLDPLSNFGRTEDILVTDMPSTNHDVVEIDTINQNARISDQDLFSYSEAEEGDELYRKRSQADHHFDETSTSILTPPSSSSSSSSAPLSISSSVRLLDDTRWRLMLNIGREQGTWMPKTWGVSGDRARIHLELEFKSDQLYERDEFLNGFTGAKLLKVIHGEGELAPSMERGGRKVRMKETGGWRVAHNEGPMGTSVLRFYFDLEEESRHAGSDVYCPAGRIYCTCGYFPMEERHPGGQENSKEGLKKKLLDIETRYECLAVENELDSDFISLKKFQRSKSMMDLRNEATKIGEKMYEAHVREPDRSLLRLSQDQSVGLTKEGGVCCKVHKGLAIEYHILGKFEIASMENREHADYRDVLLP